MGGFDLGLAQTTQSVTLALHKARCCTPCGVTALRYCGIENSIVLLGHASNYIGGDAIIPRPFADKRRLVPHAKSSRMHLSKQQWNRQVSALAGLRGLDLFSTTAEGEEVHLLCHQPWSISPSSATQTPPSPRRCLCGPSAW